MLEITLRVCGGVRCFACLRPSVESEPEASQMRSLDGNAYSPLTQADRDRDSTTVA